MSSEPPAEADHAAGDAAPAPVDAAQHEELHEDDDRGVRGEGEADGAGRDLADLARERGEAGLHLPVADEAREEGQRRDPQDGRPPEDGEVAGATGPLALQHHGGYKDGKYNPASSLVQFRNISIREL